MRLTPFILVALMVLTPLSAMTSILLPEQTTSESVDLTEGWGESWSGSTVTLEGTDWEVLETRGLGDWQTTLLEGMSDDIEDLDVAISPDQTIKACGYNATDESLEVYTLSPDGATTRVTVDSDGNVGRGCSIIIDYRGFARIAYLDVDESALKVVRENDYTPMTGDDWLVRTLVNDVTITASPEIAIYSNGSIAIAYQDADTGGLHLMRYTGSWWRHTPMVTSGAAEDIVLNIDVNDVLHLSFVDTLNQRVAVISLEGDVRTFSVVDEGEGVGQPLGHHLDSTTRAQLVYGIDDGTGLRIVRDLAGRDDGRISPEPYLVLETNASTEFGTDANSNGDFNADGYSDLIYGEPGANDSTGAIHIHYGSVSGYAQTPDLSLFGGHQGARFGASLAMIGDADGNGYDDILVGAPNQNNATGNTTGAAALYSGFATGLNPNPVWAKWGTTTDGLFGANVGAAGDVNGDGYADFMVCEKGWEGPDEGLGKVHIHLGNSTISTQSVEIVGHEDNLILGYSILGLGDGNGDGFDDIVIGSSMDITDVSGRGRAQVHYGGINGIDSTANHTWSVMTQWTLLGNSLSALGDVNNDGYDDFAISEILDDKLWIFHGHEDGYPENPTTLMDIENGWGWNIQTAGDINDDGLVDFLIGDVQGGIQLVAGTNTSQLVEPGTEFYSRSGNANSLLGRILSAGGDADRDGTHEFLYASTTRMEDGVSTGGSIVIKETRDWELSDLPFNFTVNSLDLAVDAQGRTQLLLDTDSGVYHYERANEHLTSADPWGATFLGTPQSASMVVSAAGQSTVVHADGTNLAFERREGATILSNTLSTQHTSYGIDQSIALKSDGFIVGAFTKNDNSVLFVNQTAGGIDLDVVSSGASIDSVRTVLLLDENETPHIIWAMDSELKLGIQNGTSWDTHTLTTDVESQFSAQLAANGSLAIAAWTVTGSTGLVAEWWASDGTSWSRNSTIDVDAPSPAGSVDMRLDGNDIHILWSNLSGNLDAQLARIDSNGITMEELPEMQHSGGALFLLEDGYLLPGNLSNQPGSHVLVDESGNHSISIECSLLSHITVVESDGLWAFCPNDWAEILVFEISDKSIPMITLRSDVLAHYHPAVVRNETGVWSILTEGPLSAFRTEAILLQIHQDTDRDFIPDFADDLPQFGGQWTDSDGDGYGENLDAPSADLCPTIEGYSAYGHHGCGDVDGDGFANIVDDCSNSGKSWRDVLGCPDSDGDGWSDPSGEPGWDGDRHPTNWMQAIDTDGDGRYDNHGPDCCGQNAESDEFPLDPQQWVDADGDGWGDNSSAPTGDKCPGVEGGSIYDRGGCLDSDGDGYSDPEPPTSSKPYGWTYNATRCYNSWVDDEGNTRAAGEHCADLYPWAEDDTSSENICLTRCNEQWGDRDGDGYGDNSSEDAWNRDAFPLDWTQFEDEDGDGYGNNNSEGATNPDDCPTIWGNSTVDKKGCTDTDGDGHSDFYTYESYVVNNVTLRANESGDALPEDPNQWRDKDGDGFGENPIGENWDRCPEIPGALRGTPGPGCELAENDDDGDNVANDEDDCPSTPEDEIANSDGCSPSQIDTDGDSVFDHEDICPDTPSGDEVNEVGCSLSQTNIDTDGDGVNDVDENADQLDLCPNTAEEDYGDVDENGCAPSQLDTDGDGVTDDLDACPDTRTGSTVTSDGCTEVGVDTDNDGFEDTEDSFPSEPTQWADEDEDGFGDNWADGSWNDTREGTVGEWVLNAANPDSCPEESGTSDNSAWAGTGTEVILGCVDSDSDGWADSIDWDADEPTQWADVDEDGFGDNKSGSMGDQCVGQPGIADVDGDTGPHKNGCPAPDEDDDGVFNNLDQCQGTDANTTVDASGCAAYQRDTDDDGVSDDVDQCPGTPADDWNLVDRNTGCTPTQLEEDEESSMGGILQYVGIGFGVIFGLLVIIFVVRRIRGGQIDWDDEEDDFYADDDDEDDWSPFGGVATSSPAPTRSFSPPQQTSTPSPVSRGPPMGGSSRGPPVQSRGPPTRSETSSPPSTSRPSGPSRTSRKSSPGMRPGAPAKQSVVEPEKPVRKTRRTAASPTNEGAVRKTRRTAKSPQSDAAPRTRKSRRTAAEPKQSRKRRSSTSFDDLFGADEKPDFDAAVVAAKERLIVGDSEQSVLARLQSEGWNVKQSKFILGHARP